MNKEEARKSYLRHVDNLCKDIAQVRRMYETEGFDTDEFDKHLNECCTKWADHYNNMHPTRLAIEAIKEIVEAGFGDYLAEKLIKNQEDK